MVEGTVETYFLIEDFEDCDMMELHNTPMLPTSNYSISVEGGINYLQIRPTYDALTEQILDIFDPPPRVISGWWPNEGEENIHITRILEKKHPDWKLWQYDHAVEKAGGVVTLEHAESEIMLGHSKAATAYFQHNKNFRTFIDELTEGRKETCRLK